MAGRKFVVIAEGRKHRLGWTDSHSGIWRKRFGRWRPVAKYPLGDDGLRAAQQHFATLEPRAVYVNLAAGTPLVEKEASRWAWAGLTAATLVGSGVAAVLVTHPLSTHAQAASSATTTTTTAVAPPGGGWVSASTTEVDYLQWAGSGPALQGTLTKVQVTGRTPNERSSTNSQPVTGTNVGRQVSLSVAGASAVYGSLSGTGLAVNWPGPDGSITPQVFEPTSAAGYDQAVQGLLQQAVGANASGGSPVCAEGACLAVPPAPSGYQEIGSIASAAGSKHRRLHFSARPLQLCFAVSDPSIRKLTYQIGTSWFFGGPTTMFTSSGGNSVTNGCVSDPGNDSGGENVAIHADGPGPFIVAVYESLQ
jgi:hypothetical protein